MLGIGLLVSATACSQASGGSSAPLMVDGIYQTSGAYSWGGFHDGNYTVWSTGPTCNADLATAPSSCAHTGTYEFDPDTATLTMVDGISGSVTTYAISGMETAAPTTSGLSAGLQIRGLGNAASTVGGSPSGVSAGGSAVTAGAGAIGLDSSDLSQFHANVTSGGSQVAANWKAIIYLGCQLLTGGDPNIGTNPIEPVTPPAPITQSCSAAGGKKAGA